MDSPSPSLRDLVQSLLAVGPTATGPPAHEAGRLFETLRIQLTKLAGADGFTSLMRRALALAKAESTPLASVKLGPDGRLEGIEEVAPEAAVALAAHLLGLLVTFIGEPLTLRLVREAWPDTSPDTFRITAAGLQTFPRTFGLTGNKSEHVKGQRRLSTGVRELDALMGGGIPEGDSLLVAGPSGAGKTVIGIQYIAEGLTKGEPCIVAMFEELPNEFMQRAASFGFDLAKNLKDGSLKLIYLRPLDLSVDETVHEIVSAVKEIGCKRLVIDSLVGFEMALAPDFRTDFRESLYRMIGAPTRLGVTIVSTVEVEENFTSMGLSNFTISFLADDIVRLRYASINGQLRKIMMVVKMRRSQHSIDMCAYEVSAKGLSIGEPMRGYRALTSGIPGPWSLESGEVPQRSAQADGGNTNG